MYRHEKKVSQGSDSVRMSWKTVWGQGLRCRQCEKDKKAHVYITDTSGGGHDPTETGCFTQDSVQRTRKKVGLQVSSCLL